MSAGRCPLHCHSEPACTRRDFLRGSAGVLAGSVLLGGCASVPSLELKNFKPIRACGPASKFVPTIHAAFVRRKEEYGMWWPGAVYDGQAAQKMYTQKMQETAQTLGVKFDLRAEPIYSLAQGEQWIEQAKNAQADGVVLVMLDRQKHSWPTAQKVANSGIRSILYAPLGTSFTTNTVHVAEKPGCVTYATNEFSQAAYGMKMLAAAAKINRTRCVVIKGNKRFAKPLADLGITLQHVPARTFLDEYNDMAETKTMQALAQDYIRQAREVRYATQQDVVNGIKSYFVAAKILQDEQADAITMDCLGALGKSKISLPCIAWSRMNDDRIPAACEADYGAVASHIIVQYLCDRPGFQQDPVADTADDTLIGAHCSCPTRLNGFDAKPEPFDIVHHHGNRDAVPRTLWKLGQRVTSVDLLPNAGTGFQAGVGDQKKTSKMLISVGTVVDNMSVPPSGGCVVSVKVKFDGRQEVLTFPGFHQLFFYGDFGRELTDFCQLCNLEAQIV
jgi:hypothetical protein